MHTNTRKPSALMDLLRVLLVPASLIVAAGLLLVALPESATDSIIRKFQSGDDASGGEKIAFLYLGHETENKKLHIRGVVRNISAAPVDQLDATIRLFASNMDLLETVIVRMDKETIAPNEIARFELVYPNYGPESGPGFGPGLGSYSVEFKMRQGKAMPYKDRRNPNRASAAPPGE